MATDGRLIVVCRVTLSTPSEASCRQAGYLICFTAPNCAAPAGRLGRWSRHRRTNTMH